MKNPPIIIIGAGRSGTNILRDSLCRFPGIATWPCDEINYIWRHGNISKSTDRFTSIEARSEVKKYIIKAFETLEKQTNAHHIVEKTCSNSLKIPFINEIFPTAKYLFLIRDGMDVASSARLRWTASLDMKYILKKAKFVPIQDIPFYSSRYFINRVKKIASKEKRLAYWGPIYPGMMEDLKKETLIEVCGKQWSNCVQTAIDDLAALPKNQIFYLKYEDFVKYPKDILKKVAEFLNFDYSNKCLEMATGRVSAKSIGNYNNYLSKDEIEKLRSIIDPVMKSVYNSI